MTTTSNVLSDMAALRSELRQQCDPHCELFRLSPWRAVLDIAFDWLIVLSSVALVVWWSELFAPLAVVLIANRDNARSATFFTTLGIGICGGIDGVTTWWRAFSSHPCCSPA